MTTAIIGAKGEMAQNLLLPMLKKSGEIIEIDRESSSEDWQRAWSCPVIWLALPREAIPEIVKDIRLRPEQLIVDITSIKRGLSKVIAPTGAAHLSLHPLHGPYIPLAAQKWAVIQTGLQIEGHEKALAIMNFLKSEGI